jgi:hypothetical protein
MLKQLTAVIGAALTLGFACALRADAVGSVDGSGSMPTAAPGDLIGGNCIPFACDGLFGINTYQQVYSSTAFLGITPFNQISFFLTDSGGLDSGTYTIDFSYTSAPVNGLSSASPSDNIGADETLFGSYMLTGGPGPSTLTFTGNTFNYDPSMGNLLMTIFAPGVVDSGPPFAFYAVDGTGTFTSRAYFGSTQSADSIGLVTRFNQTSAVPEPGNLSFLGAGLLLSVFVQQRLRSRSS